METTSRINQAAQTRIKGPTVPIDSRYVRGKAIGRGASGTVYEGVQLSVNRKVAIKVLNPKHRDEKYRLRFDREALAIASMNHPNCVTIYDYGHDDALDQLYMVMEFVEGRTLAKVQRYDSLSISQILDISIQILKGLEHAHERGILHRDLKPANVVITDDGNAKVLDFGMAAIRGSMDEEGKRITRDGAIYGTPPYMSPEQCNGERGVDHRTDLYSFGVMLFELIEGHLPYDSTRAIDILVKHINEPIPSITTEGVPTELSDIVNRLLQKRPDDRFESATDVIHELESARSIQSRTGSFSTPIATSVSEVVDTWDRAERGVSRQIKLAISLSAMLLFGLAYAWFANMEERSEVPIVSNDQILVPVVVPKATVDRSAAAPIELSNTLLDAAILNAAAIAAEKAPTPESGTVKPKKKVRSTKVPNVPEKKKEKLKTIKFTY